MAGTEILYSMQFQDYCGNLCTVQIVKPGYSGATTVIAGGGNPCVINWLGEGDDKFAHFKASEAAVEFVNTSNLQFLDLFLATNKSYKVRIYRGSDPIWQGWINPEYYSEPFVSVESHIITTITATDGIALLKNVKYPIPSYTVFKHSVISYIATCLSQIGLDNSMSIKVALGMSATTSADGVVTSRLLEKLFIDYRSIRETDDGDIRSCYDVLELILKSLNARIYQFADAWHIERIDHKHTAYDIEVYSMAGVYGSTHSNFNAVVELTANLTKNTTIRFINDPATLEVQPAYRTYKIGQSYGNRINLLDSTHYTLFKDEDWISDTELRFWTADAGMEIARENNHEAVRIKGINEGLDLSLLSNIVNIENEGVFSVTNLVDAWYKGKISLVLSFDCAKRFYAKRGLNQHIANMKLGANFSGTLYYAENSENQFTLRISGGNQHLTGQDTGRSLKPLTFSTNSSGALLSGAHSVSITLTDTADWVNAKVEMASPPDDEVGKEQTYLRLFIELRKASTNLAPEDVVDTDGVLFKNIRLYFHSQTKVATIDNGNDRVDDYRYETETTINENNILTPEPYEINYGDTPAPYDNDGWGLINKYVFFDSGGFAVNLFGNGLTHTLSLVRQVIESDLNAAYRRPQFKLRGSIIDTTYSASNLGLSFQSVLKDYNYRYYFPTGLTYAMREAICSGEWMQMWEDSEAGTGEFNDDFSEDFWI
jgi:hypothetical protein